MSVEDLINDDFAILDEETLKVSEEISAIQRKLMEPIWYKRREMVKKIPNFWGQTVSAFFSFKKIKIINETVLGW